jgi:hypothetical protein
LRDAYEDLTIANRLKGSRSPVRKGQEGIAATYLVSDALSTSIERHVHSKKDAKGNLLNTSQEGIVASMLITSAVRSSMEKHIGG